MDKTQMCIKFQDFFFEEVTYMLDGKNIDFVPYFIFIKKFHESYNFYNMDTKNLLFVLMFKNKNVRYTKVVQNITVN